MSQLITFSEAAVLTGVSVKSIYRHVAKGRLMAVQTLQGKRIDRDTLTRYLSHAEKDVQTEENGPSQNENAVPSRENAESRPGPGEKSVPTRENGPSSGDKCEKSVPSGESGVVPLAAHLAAIDLARAQLAQVEYYREQADAARHQALAAERARMALELQLGQYQRALSEQADSLAEERAGRLAAEASAMVVPAVVVPDQALSDLKTDTPTPKRGWGQRLGRWLLGQKTG